MSLKHFFTLLGRGSFRSVASKAFPTDIRQVVVRVYVRFHRSSKPSR